MLAAKVPLNKANEILKYLSRKGLREEGHGITKDSQFLYIPVKKRIQALSSTGVTFVSKDLPKYEKPQGFREYLKGKLTKQELDSMCSSYDIMGNIIVIEIPHELEKKEKLIAEALLKAHPQVSTIAKKVGGHGGELRIQKVKILAGKKSLMTLYRENNAVFRLNIAKTYFSPRLVTERKRIASLVRSGESVLVMFSGIAPYPIVIAKNSDARDIVAVELNKEAHKYAIENVALNKVKNITVLQGDARKIVPKLKRRFDRIIMPLPKTADTFLDIALAAASPGAVIHFYDFQRDSDIPKGSTAKVKAACKVAGRKCRIISVLRCGQTAPRAYRVCTDFVVDSPDAR